MYFMFLEYITLSSKYPDLSYLDSAKTHFLAADKLSKEVHFDVHENFLEMAEKGYEIDNTGQ